MLFRSVSQSRYIANNFMGNKFISIGTGLASRNAQTTNNTTALPVFTSQAFYSALPFAAPIIDEYGIKPKFHLYLTEQSVGPLEYNSQVTPNTVLWYTPGTYCNTTGIASSGSTYGMGGYNERTKTLVACRATTSGTIEVHRWINKNRRLDNNLVSFQTFMSEAYAGTGGATYTKSAVLSYTYGRGTNTTTEANLNIKVIPMHDGRVALVRHTPSSGLYFSILDSTLSTIIDVGSNTTPQTSYGREQGNLYGVECAFSWDNNWMAVYAPYANYFPGALVMFINIANPTNLTTPTWYTWRYEQTSWGISLVPCGESGFIASNYASYSGTNGFYFDLEGIRTSGYSHDGTLISSGSNITSLTANVQSLPSGQSGSALITMPTYTDSVTLIQQA